MRPNLRKIAIGFGAAISVGVMMAAVLAPTSAQYHHGKCWHRGYAGFRGALPLDHYYGYPPYPLDYHYGLASKPRNAKDEGERNCLWRRRQRLPDFEGHLVWRRTSACY